ncbi:MAG: hypothetical protein J0H74_25745 [Chitinophagaceae bacterium]|nr:hypothetical protein [Chitinophagaceae bacterium]
MRPLLTITATLLSILVFAQDRSIIGTYKDFKGLLDQHQISVTFNQDSTFQYWAKEHPVFYYDHFGETFSENGKWTMIGDTIVLNPQLEKRTFVESEVLEQENPADTGLTLTFNHINRWIDPGGNVVRTDTVQIWRLDYAFNERKKKNTRRVSPHRTVRCTFAGYIPKEIITQDRTIVVEKPREPIRSIYVGCYEQQGTKAFPIRNPASTRLTFNVYSNHYQDGLFRHVKWLAKSDGSLLYLKQKSNGKFRKGLHWSGPQDNILKKQRVNS